MSKESAQLVPERVRRSGTCGIIDGAGNLTGAEVSSLKPVQSGPDRV